MMVLECECGKEFVKNPNSLYKLVVNKKTVYYCSYTCYMKAKNKQGRNKKKYRRVTEW
jgi:hypothetical protein